MGSWTSKPFGIVGTCTSRVKEFDCLFMNNLQADEMAKTFRQRVAQAEAAARAEELRLQQEVLFSTFFVSSSMLTYTLFKYLLLTSRWSRLLSS